MTSTDPATEAAARGTRRLILVALVLVALVVAADIGAVKIHSARNAPKTYSYVVEKGTAARAASGEVIKVLPSKLELSVGDRLVIKNEDSKDFIVGPYKVLSGETLEQTFRTPGSIAGACGLTPTDDISITIS